MTGILGSIINSAREYKPGDLVPESGIYTVTHDPSGTPVHDVTCIEGRHFPPSRTGKHPRFKLKLAAEHIADHPDYDGSKY